MKKMTAALMALLLMLQLLPTAAIAGPDGTYRGAQVLHAVFFGDEKYIFADGTAMDVLPAAPERDRMVFVGWYDGDTLIEAPFTPKTDMALEARYVHRGTKIADTAYTGVWSSGPEGTQAPSVRAVNAVWSSGSEYETLEAFLFDPVMSGMAVDLEFKADALVFALDAGGNVVESLGTAEAGKGITVAPETVRGYCLARKQTNVYTVTFLADGKEIASAVAAAGTCLKDLPEAPDMDGQAFVGWYADGVSFTAETPVTGDMQVNAVYTVVISESEALRQKATFTFSHTGAYAKVDIFGTSQKNQIPSPRVNPTLSGGLNVTEAWTVGNIKNRTTLILEAVIVALPSEGTLRAYTVMDGKIGDLVAENLSVGDKVTVKLSFKGVDGLALVTAAAQGTEGTDETDEIEDALYANDDLYITGKIPGNGIIEVTPVRASVADEELIAAYDITVYANEKMREAGREWQPADKKVRVHLRNDRFVGETVNVYHMGTEGPERIASVESDAEGWISFEAGSFSVYIFTRTIEKTVTIGGNTYKITVTYTSDAHIPDDAELKVTEVSADKCLTDTASALGLGVDDDVFYTKFLDIAIVSGGVTIEPQAPVEVTVELLDVDGEAAQALEVVHFTGGGAEKVNSEANAEGVVTFTADSFSVYGFSSILRSLISWTGDAVSCTLQGFSALLQPAYTPVSVTLEEGLELLNAFTVDGSLGSALNALYVKVRTQVSPEGRETVSVYSLTDGTVGDVLIDSAADLDRRIPLSSAAGFAVVKDTGYRHRTFDLGQVNLDGMLPRNAEASAEAADVEMESEVLAAFDISIAENGAGYQPDPEHPVSVSITAEGISADKLIRLWHIRDDGTREEITAFSVEGETLSFVAEGFSVYVIGVDPSAKYVFHGPDGSEYEFENELGVKTTYQMVAQGGTLYNPGAPDAPEDMDNPRFLGWWTKIGVDWDKEIIPPDAESVTVSGEDFTAEQIDLYARYSGTYYIVYHDEMDNVLVTETTPLREGVSLYGNDGKLRVELVLSAEFALSNAFLGWSKEQGEHTQADVLDDPFDFDEDVGTQHLYPVIAPAYWITFDKNDWKYTPNANHNGAYDLDPASDPASPRYIPNPDGTGAYDRAGTGASYVAPRFVLQGERYSTRYQDVPSSTRPGYTFLGWYYDEDLTQPFDPDTVPTGNVTVYAKWQSETTPYTVQYWLQDPNTGVYALKDVELKLWEGTTGGQTAVTPDALTKQVNDQGTVVDGPAVKDKYPHYKLHTADPADEHTIENTEILGDESTVVNVYYDCQTYTLRFIYARSSAGNYSYEAITNEQAATLSQSVYGLVNGSYVVLTQSGGIWKYNNHTQTLYNGTRYREYTGNSGTNYGIVNGNIQQIYRVNGVWRIANSTSAEAYTGTRYRADGGTRLLGWVNGEMKQLTQSGNSYYYSTTTQETYSGQLFKRTAGSNLQYQITEDVHHYWLHDVYSSSWSTIQNGITSHNENWNNVTEKPQVDMPDGGVLGSFDDGNYTYYYLDVTHLKYEQILTSVWPDDSVMMQVGRPNSTTTYKFTSWGTQVNSPYWTDAAGRTGDDGKYTIKGAYRALDDMLMNAANNGNTIVNDGDLLAFVFLGRYKTDPIYYNYHVYADLLDDEIAEKTYNGVGYKEFTVIDNVTSSAPPRDQAKPSIHGLKWIAGPLTANNATPSGTTPAGGSHIDLYYYYERELYDLNIFRNHEGDTYTEEGAAYSTQKVKFGQRIDGYLEKSSKNHLLEYAEYVVGETRYTAESGEEFVFTGWYTNPEGLGTPVDLTRQEMTGDLFIYAGWRPVRYRVWVQPNGGVLSSSESTWFNLDYGETVGSYDDVTRDYLRDDEAGTYYYVIYDHEAPRSAGYVPISEATEDQVAHALRDGNTPIKYKYLKNAYALVGWYLVEEEEFGTYEQYYANGNSNDGTYTVRPPSINESDTLSSSNYVFGTPVKKDLAIRAIWKRAGTIAVEFDPQMADTQLKGLVPQGYAAKTTDGEYILSYKENGTPNETSADASQDQWIYPLTEQVYADLSKVEATVAPIPPEGYYFVGWRTPYGTIVQANDLITLYVDLARFIGTDQATGDPWYRYTVTAEYAKIDTVSLTYDINVPAGMESQIISGILNNQGSQNNNSQLDKNTDNELNNLLLNHEVILSDGEGFERKNYTLIGWSKTPGENNTVDYELGAETTFIDDEDTTLYAVWQAWGWLKIGKHFDVQEPYLDGIDMSDKWNPLEFTVTDSQGNTIPVKANGTVTYEGKEYSVGINDPAGSQTIKLESFVSEVTGDAHTHQYFYYVWVPVGSYTVTENSVQADNLMPGYTRQNGPYQAGPVTVPAGDSDSITGAHGEARIDNNYRGNKAYLNVSKQVAGDAPAELTSSKEYKFIVYNNTLKAYLASVNWSIDNLGKYTPDRNAAQVFTIKPGDRIKMNGNYLNGPGTIPILAGDEYSVIELEDDASIPNYDLEVSYNYGTAGAESVTVAKGTTKTVTITNTYTPSVVEMKLEKTVSGNMASFGDEFTFSVTAKNGSEDVPFTVKDKYGNILENHDSITLCHNGYVTLTLPIGASVTIAESDPTPYTASASGVTGGTFANNAYSFTVSTANNGEKALFNNEHQEAPDTGVTLDTKPYVTMLILAYGALMLGALWRKRQEE